MANSSSLRFADGGAITRWARSIMRPDNTANRLREVEAPPPPPPPPPPKPKVKERTAADIRFQSGGSLSKEAVREAILRQQAAKAQSAPAPAPQPSNRLRVDFLRNPGGVVRERERQAGIGMQDGGVVPGTGEGDKIPAKYEPGEFVVSNDMIDDNPGLAEELSAMRAKTLAARGKTVEEADAGIMTPKGLRAQNGYDPFDRMTRTLTGSNPLPARSPMGAVAEDLRRGPLAPAPAAPAAPTPRTPLNLNSDQARAWKEEQARRAAPPVAPPAAPAPAPQGRAYKAGRATGSLLRGATPLAAGFAAVEGFNTDTEDYARRFGLENTEPGLLRDVGIRGLGVASDLGNALTFGLAGNLFRDKQDQEQAALTSAVPPAPRTSAPTGVPPAPQTQRAAPGVTRVDGGSSPLFTNVAGEDNERLMSRGPVSSQNMAAASALDARSRLRTAQPAAAPEGPNVFVGADTGGFGLLDNDARRERSLRMDADQFKPGARGALRAFYGRQAQGDEISSAERIATERDTTARRGQDMDLEGRRAEASGRIGAEQAKGLRDAQIQQTTAKLWQASGGDPERFQALAMQAGLTDVAKAGGEMASSAQTRGFNASKNATGRLESMAIVDGKIDPARLAQVRATANSVVPNFESMDEASQAAAMPRVLAAINTLQAQNQLRDPTLSNMIGLSQDSPERTTLPDLRGGKVSEVGFLEGATTARVGRGDYKVTLPNGRTVYMARDKINENELDLLKAQGATLQ